MYLGEGLITLHDFENVVLFNRVFKIKEEEVTCQAFYFQKCFGTYFLRVPTNRNGYEPAVLSSRCL